MAESNSAALRAGAESLTPPSAKPLHDSVEIPFLELLNAVMRRRMLVVGLAGLFLVLVDVRILLRARTFTVSSSFMPQAKGSPGLGGLAGVAVQMGLGGLAGEGSQTPLFYLDLLKSRAILEPVVDARYTYTSDTGTVAGSLLDILRAKGRNDETRRDLAIRRLRSAVAGAVNQRTGVVTFSVRSVAGVLSLQISQRMLDELNKFNLERRQSQAGAERRFTEGRVNEAKARLHAAEDRLESFLQRNRDYRNSPQLSFQEDRLARDVAMQQQIFTSLSQVHEQAKIEEVRDTPVITVLERPVVPVRPDSRGLVFKSLLGIFIGATLGIMLSLGGEVLKRTRKREPALFDQFIGLRDEAAKELRHPMRAAAQFLRRGREARGRRAEG